MKKSKRRYYWDSYDTVKRLQWKTRRKSLVVHNYEVDDIMINGNASKVNKRRRSRVGFVEKMNDSD